MDSLIYQLKTHNPDLKNAEILGLLHILMTQHGISSNELVRFTGLPKETLRQFKASVANLLIDSTQDSLTLSNDGLARINILNPQPYTWAISGLPDVLTDRLVQQLSAVRQKYNLTPNRDFDQFFATTKTSVSKYFALHYKGCILDKKIAFLGDDDFVSIVLGMASQEYKSMMVFDIDQGILDTLRTVSSELNIKNLQTAVYDARDEVDTKYKKSFDVVITDPPYTKAGITLFLNRAVELLMNDKTFEGKYIFLYFGNSFKSPEKTLKIQEIISRFNLLIEDKIDKFARYHGAESIGSTSSLYVLKTTPFTRPLEDALKTTQIYTFDATKEEKFPYVDHLVFKLFNVPTNIVNSKSSIYKAVGDFCNKHRLKVVDEKTTKFKGNGLTLTFVLSSSNLLVHTWPEHNAIHIDLITCSPIYKREELTKSLSELFNTKTIETRYIE